MQEGKLSIQVVADDTDIFIILVYYCWKWCLQSRNIYIYIWSDGSIIDINASTIQLDVQCRDLLAMHALSGSDTSGKGKMTALKILPNVELQCIANLESSSEEIVDADQKKYLLYETKTKLTMAELRYRIFCSKKDIPKMKSPPPTYGPLYQHILRAHLQVILWKSAEQNGPPDIDIYAYGWVNTAGKLVPRVGATEMTPADLHKVVACGCVSVNACNKNIRSCRAGGLSCTLFCKCEGHEDCHNPYTIHTHTSDDENEENIWKSHKKMW